MNIGRLNRRIILQQQSIVQDPFGQPQQSWATAYSCWASIDIQNSQLLYSTAEFAAKVTYRIELRWSSSVIVAPNMRVVFTEPTTRVAHTYEIQAVLNDMQANKKLILICYELNGKS